MAQAELGVRLVAAAFLALAVGVDDVMGEPPVARSVMEVFDAAVEDRPVVAEHADGHHRLDAAGVPVAVGESGEVLDGRIEDVAATSAGTARRPLAASRDTCAA